MDINGNEELILKNETSKFGIYALTLALPTVFGFILSIIAQALDDNAVFSDVYFKSFILLFILTVLFVPKSIKKENTTIKKSKELNSYFKNKFHIINEFDPEKHESLGVAYAEKEENMEIAMFQVYLSAYKADADAIVLNSSTSNTHVSGNVKTQRNIFVSNTVSGSTSSYSSTSIMATLIKYKKAKNQNIKKEQELEEAIA